MKNKLNETDAAFYRANGYIVLRQILPAALITDLRRAADQARAVARRLDGPQAQRLQSTVAYPEIDPVAIRAFAELPALAEALATVLSPAHNIRKAELIAFLFEPAERCWATEWHRDWRDHMPAEKIEKIFDGRWEQAAVNPDYFNQINCALYEDTSTWYVPGSHARLQDTAAEIKAAKSADRAAVENKEGVRTEVEQEIFLQDYCTGMPGAVQLHLQAGDLALYRNIGWHIGSYVPYRKRSTLHCAVATPAYEALWQKAEAVLKK